jgi:hypothetical protein
MNTVVKPNRNLFIDPDFRQDEVGLQGPARLYDPQKRKSRRKSGGLHKFVA